MPIIRNARSSDTQVWVRAKDLTGPQDIELDAGRGGPRGHVEVYVEADENTSFNIYGAVGGQAVVSGGDPPVIVPLEWRLVDTLTITGGGGFRHRGYWNAYTHVRVEGGGAGLNTIEIVASRS